MEKEHEFVEIGGKQFFRVAEYTMDCVMSRWKQWSGDYYQLPMVHHQVEGICGSDFWISGSDMFILFDIAVTIGLVWYQNSAVTEHFRHMWE